jgi:hypothetical protein
MMIDKPVDEIFRPPDRVVSWLRDGHGQPRQMSLDEVPFAE